MENNELELARQKEADLKERMKYDCKLLTKHAYDLLDVIKEAEIKDDVIGLIKDFTKVQKEHVNMLEEIKAAMLSKGYEFYNTEDESTSVENQKKNDENMVDFFKKNPKYHEKYKNNSMDDMQLEMIDKIVDLIILNIPKCRVRINGLIGSIYNIGAEDVENKTIDEFVGMIMGIVNSSSFASVFKIVKLFFR